MRDTKSFASLTSGLLARKGQARPAMRPQGFGQGMGHPEDLGWNDMGFDVGRPASGSLVSPRLPANLSGPHSALPSHADVPEVVRQQDEIAREFAEQHNDPEPAPAALHVVEAVVEPASVAAEARAPVAVVESLAKVVAPRRRKAAVAKTAKTAPAPSLRENVRKAAFTLRLDADRHLRLRLACAVQNRSAQQVVTDALDRLLADLPDVGRLAASLPQPTRQDRQ